ncbi:MAG: tetratricopeptide repeat protein [Polyangiaceae bacterium]
MGPARWLAVLCPLLAACAASPPPAPTAPPTHIDAEPRIVTASEVTTEQELARRGERALMEQRWQDAVEAYRTLVAGTTDPARAGEYAFDLGLALEGLQHRKEARDAFLDLARRFPEGPKARAALLRAASLDAYLEDWKALEDIGDELLRRKDLEDVDRLVALGSRGLARVEMGDDGRAYKDVLDGLDVADSLHYGDRDVLPVAVAQLRFALGEVRRVRSEKITFDPLPPDFTEKIEERAGGLLEAQAAYAMAVRSVDPHWAAMAGYRVGEMYRALHRDLMKIPPPATSKTEKQKQMFYAFMHISYRILLEKGLRELEQTVALGERTADSSAWIQRARDAREEMRTALEDEKAQIAKMPFTEDEVKEALGQLKKKTQARTAAAPAR